MTFGGQVDEKTADRVLGAFLDAGHDEIDTAFSYCDGKTEEIACATHGFAASTPAGGLEGELVAVGRGTEQELAGKHIDAAALLG